MAETAIEMIIAAMHAGNLAEAVRLCDDSLECLPDGPDPLRSLAPLDGNGIVMTRAREKGCIATPSYTQVIEPIDHQGMNRWHRYREYFEPVLPILRPMLEHWGYAAD